MKDGKGSGTHVVSRYVLYDYVDHLWFLMQVSEKEERCTKEIPCSGPFDVIG